jgi:signal transduction histidine kinase
VGRASLRWFLLSWVVGSGVFALLILLPQMFGFDTTAVQPYAFLLFVLVYVGLGFGILRFRLFGLDEWWVRIVTWLGALLLLVALDLVFLLQLQFSAGASLSLSLVVCGLLWLPLRGYLSSRMLGRREDDRPGLFKAVVGAALAPTADQREERWRDCLRLAFDPLRLEPAAHEGDGAGLAQDGLALLLQGVGGLPSLRLEYARGGRGLFGPRDVARADELLGMLRHALESRDAYEQGVRVERARIARDMHDNVGAQLLRALHTREDGRRESLLRETLSDLRGIINDASNPELSLEETLADLRYETAERLSTAGIELEWRVEGGGGQVPFSAKAVQALRSLVREAVSNIVKHARARRVEVAVSPCPDGLSVAVEDDGTGFDFGVTRAGNGLANMRARVTALGGKIAWRRARDGSGVRVELQLPWSGAKETS